MNRFFITIEYDGSGFLGWQKQEIGPSIQETLENAVKKFTKQSILVYGAGRTDAGVHASGQVAHLDLPDKFTSNRVMEAINAYLLDVRVKVIEVKSTVFDAHARFSAISREYEYSILNRSSPPALNAGKNWHQRLPQLDVDKMQIAANHLIGTHDFTSFRATQCQSKSPLKTLDLLTIERNGETINIKAKAKSFLHHQIRNIAGTLVLVGRGKWNPNQIVDCLKMKNRTAAGPTAPAEGLVLKKILYPNEIYI